MAKSNGTHPAPGPSFVYEVRTFSNYPIQDLDFRIQLYDHDIFMLYQNGAQDLIALVMAKLGQVFSAHDIEGGTEAISAKVEAVSAAIAAIEP